MSDGSKRYNCSIIDIHDCSIIASLNGKEMTSQLAINTLQKALTSQVNLKKTLILHSDQGSQYTSEGFTDFCQLHKIKQDAFMITHLWNVITIPLKMSNIPLPFS